MSDFEDDWLDDDFEDAAQAVSSASVQDGGDDVLTGEALDPEKPSLQDSQSAIMAKCYHSRVYFAEVVLGVVLEDWQFEVLSELDSGATRISIRSGNGAGKTCLLAIIILHFILFRNDVKIPVTAPSSGQLKDGLIPETRKWMRKLPEFLRRLIDTTQDRIVRVDSPEQNFVSFRTARRETPEALQGIHAENVLCVVDEASAVPDEVYEAAQGTMSTPGSIFIMISNPTRLQGYFYRSHHRMKHAWKTFHVTSFDTSRVDQSFVDQIAEDYGIRSDQYRVKVLGEFPTKDEQTLIPNDIVRAAFKRDIAKPKARPVWGLDVGRGGDLSALVSRTGPVMGLVGTQNYSDTMQTVSWVTDLYHRLPEADRPETLYVDSIGIGAGVADRLRELGLPAVDINVSESASMKTRYLRLRDELWWTMKKWFETMNVRMEAESQAESDMIESEICAPLQVFTDSGKDAVETKKQMKARGVRSPNIADACCLTFAFDAAVGLGLTSSAASSWKKPLAFTSAAPSW